MLYVVKGKIKIMNVSKVGLEGNLILGLSVNEKLSSIKCAIYIYTWDIPPLSRSKN